MPQANFTFSVNDDANTYASQYKYLGLVLTEHLDYSVTANIVAQSENRALDLLIAKSKAGIRWSPIWPFYKTL